MDVSVHARGIRRINDHFATIAYAFRVCRNDRILIDKDRTTVGQRTEPLATSANIYHSSARIA